MADLSFGKAFAAARKAQGANGTFTYKGKSYSTKQADDTPKSTPTPPKRPAGTGNEDPDYSNAGQGVQSAKKGGKIMPKMTAAKFEKSAIDKKVDKKAINAINAGKAPAMKKGGKVASCSKGGKIAPPAFGKGNEKGGTKATRSDRKSTQDGDKRYDKK